ncbi:unnamed protein product [Protopolystoma xenopodis]|uniref:Uncharacterized protein n=1 Tax=Protopolystoma xenopodis TaxID=117903 RepID=A0A3S5C9N0_9PLAT|nr:unnamed protein product [Protopolystoma xenopodis]
MVRMPNEDKLHAHVMLLKSVGKLPIQYTFASGYGILAGSARQRFGVCDATKIFGVRPHLAQPLHPHCADLPCQKITLIIITPHRRDQTLLYLHSVDMSECRPDFAIWLVCVSVSHTKQPPLPIHHCHRPSVG